MKKDGFVVVNSVQLGKRTVGWEVYNMESGEIEGFTNKQLLKMMEDDSVQVYGLKPGKDDEGNDCPVLVDGCNAYEKAGIATFTPKKPLGTTVSLILSLIKVSGKDKKEYTFINHKFGQVVFGETKASTIVELGGFLNGIKVDKSGAITTWFDEEVKEG